MHGLLHIYMHGHNHDTHHVGARALGEVSLVWRNKNNAVGLEDCAHEQRPHLHYQTWLVKMRLHTCLSFVRQRVRAHVYTGCAHESEHIIWQSTLVQMRCRCLCHAMLQITKHEMQ